MPHERVARSKIIRRKKHHETEKDICFPCTKEFKQEFDQTVLGAYQQELSMLQQRQQEQSAAPSMGMSTNM